jgi:quinol monooxygenase YgiN
MIYVIATLKIRPGTLEALANLAQPLIVGTRAEAGCLLYDLTASITDPETAVFLEKWESREALQAHYGTPHFASWSEANKAYVLSAKIEIIHPERIELV